MNFYTVLILECMLFVHASCRSIGNGKTDEALSSTINMTLENIRTVSYHLTRPGLLPEKHCNSSIMMELLGPDQQPLTAHHFNTSRCYMEEFSNRIPELSEHLKIIVQFMETVEVQISGTIISKNCSLPAFKGRLEEYLEAKCFLEITWKRLHSFKL